MHKKWIKSMILIEITDKKMDKKWKKFEIFEKITCAMVIFYV